MTYTTIISVWRKYGVQIQQTLRQDRATATSVILANPSDGGVPF